MRASSGSRCSSSTRRRPRPDAITEEAAPRVNPSPLRPRRMRCPRRASSRGGGPSTRTLPGLCAPRESLPLAGGGVADNRPSTPVPPLVVGTSSGDDRLMPHREGNDGPCNGRGVPGRRVQPGRPGLDRPGRVGVGDRQLHQPPARHSHRQGVQHPHPVTARRRRMGLSGDRGHPRHPAISRLIQL